ncbi:MAG: hypothetical protein AAF327_18080 [Cyanobacteria bacterium P01_A01_bin.37]
MPAEDLRNLEKSVPKPKVRKTSKAQVSGGKIASLDSAIADRAKVTADKANHFLMQQMGQIKDAGEQFGDAVIQIAENADNLFAAAALNRIQQRLDGSTDAPSQVSGWVYDSGFGADFNKTLEDGLTVGNEKPMLTGTAQY